MNSKTRRYDLARMASEARQIASEISQLKKHMRQPRYLPTWQEYRKLTTLKDAATVLCILRANHRGRRHLPNQLERTEAVIAKHEPTYLLESKEVAA